MIKTVQNDKELEEIKINKENQLAIDKSVIN